MSTSHWLAGVGEAPATRTLRCTQRLAMSTPQAQLLQRVGGGDSDDDEVAGGLLHNRSSGRRMLLGAL